MRKFFGRRSKTQPPPPSAQSPGTSTNDSDAALAEPAPGGRQVAFAPEPAAQKTPPSLDSLGLLSGCFQPVKASASHSGVSQPVRTAFPSADPVLRSISPLSVSSNASSFGQHSVAMQYGNDSESTFVKQPVTWAQMTFGDLVENISDRERIRQEVLWEIVASEERYVQELLSMTELFVEPLLHPDRSPAPSTSNSPSSSSVAQFSAASHSSDPSDGDSPALTPLQKGHSVSSDHLPIASKFSRTLSRTTTHESQSGAQVPDAVGLGLQDLPEVEAQTQEHTRINSESHSQLNKTLNAGFRSQRSLPASFCKQQSPVQNFRHHLKSLSPAPHKLQKPKSARPSNADQPPLVLPDALKVLLETIGESLVARHRTLGILLKERWQAQYPLVRNLASVWVDQTWIVHDYRNYVLHLEKGLEDVNAILSTVSSGKHKRSALSSTEEDRNTKRLAKLVMRLEEQAALRGESGLAICLSKPFQRLLKYPLLFQNLLYHTDASTAEYDSTRQLAIELDAVVKSIENDKISEEERDRVHDLWARIDGVNDKALMAPRSDRYLLEERSLWEPLHARRSVSDAGKEVQDHKTKSQKSVRRLSDMLGHSEKERPPSLGSKRDIWLIHLSDVVLRCQRIGETALPINALLKNENRDFKSKGRSAIAPRKRNLYRFVGIERWEMQQTQADQSEFGLVRMEDVHRATTSSRASLQAPVFEEEGQAVENNDATSRMSFSYAEDDPIPVSDPSTSQETRSFYYSSPAPLGRLSPNIKLTPSRGTQSATTRRGPSAAKFEKRMTRSPQQPQQPRSLSPRTPSSHYAAPTQAYLSKMNRPATPSNRPPSVIVRATTPAGRTRNIQSPSASSPENDAELLSGPVTREITHSRSESGIFLYNQFWTSQS